MGKYDRMEAVAPSAEPPKWFGIIAFVKVIISCQPETVAVTKAIISHR